jgi:hypothetical protein
MLLYLASKSWLEIAFAVHHYARSTHAPKKLHAQAVKPICCYLKGTNCDRLILKPIGKLVVCCCIDANFTGLWKREDDEDPMCAKLRTDFILTIASCQLIWVSKMQTEICFQQWRASCGPFPSNARVDSALYTRERDSALYTGERGA